MKRIFLLCKRPFVRLARFRHRCGYGVHSPFAFHLITGVIYETAPYYKYAPLLEEEKRLAAQHSRSWREEPLRVKRLLFRLVNYARPETVVDAGPLSASRLYLKAGREGAVYTAAAELDAVLKRAEAVLAEEDAECTEEEPCVEGLPEDGQTVLAAIHIIIRINSNL